MKCRLSSMRRIFRVIAHPIRALKAWRYKYRNCVNCPVSSPGYESADFDDCTIYGGDFRYEDCKYIWFPRKYVKKLGDKMLDEEAKSWAAYAERCLKEQQGQDEKDERFNT